METTFKNIYGLFLDGQISQQDWSMLLAMFYSQLIERADPTGSSEQLLKWREDVRKVHPKTRKES